MQYAQIILDFISKRGVSLYKLAQSTGISESTFSKWKSNPASDVSLSSVIKIAEYFRVSLDELLFDASLNKWHDMVLINGTSGIEGNHPRYCKAGNRVEIAGLLLPNTIATMPFSALPAGFRPAKPCGFAAQADSEKVFITRCCKILENGSCIIYPTDRAGTEKLPYWINFSFIAEQ